MMKNFMRLRLVFSVGVSVAVLILAQAIASAAPWLPNVINEHRDLDYEAMVVGDPTIVEVGDMFGGVIKIRDTRRVYPKPNSNPIDLVSAPDTFTAIFLVKAIGTTRVDPLADEIVTLTFGAPSAAEWESVFGAGGVLDVSNGFDVTFGGAGPALGTAAFYFDGVNYNDADANLSGLAASALPFVDGGRLLYEFGFTGPGGTADADEFWTTIGVNADITADVLTNNPTNRWALNVTQYHAGIELLPHNYLGALSTPTTDANFTGPTQLQGKGTFTDTAGDWPLGTKTDMYFHPVPEPSSFAVFAGIFGVACIWHCRRRRRQAS